MAAKRPINMVEHILIRFGGSLGEDSWSCGLRAIGDPLANDSGDASGALEAIDTYVRTFHANAAARWSGLAKLGWTKVNAIGSNGKYVNEVTNMAEHIPELASSGFGGSPPQLALAVTLRTGRKRGPAHSGRIYIPCGASTGQDGKLTEEQQRGAANAVKDLIVGINDAFNRHTVAVVGVHDAVAYPVTRVEVGSVIDTQRRRRKSFTETYFGVNV